MEPSHSHILGEAEECHSCSNESGWTIYLGSSIDDDDDGDEKEEEEEEDEENEDNFDADGDGSVDSMASDASSGPSHHHVHIEGEREAAVKTKEKDEMISQKKEEKKEMAFLDDKAKFPDTKKMRKNKITRWGKSNN